MDRTISTCSKRKTEQDVTAEAKKVRAATQLAPLRRMDPKRADSYTITGARPHGLS